MVNVRRYRMPGARTRRFTAGLAGGLVMAALLAAGPLYADSIMFRGNSGLTGAYDEKISLPLALSWKYTANFASYNPSSPAVAGNSVYFASGNRVYAVDAESGALKWRYPQDEPMPTVIRTSPAVVDGMVFFGAEDGKLHALNADTGKLAWAYDTRSSVPSSPTVVDGIVYFGSSDGRVWAVDSRTGEAVSTWRGGVKTTDEVAGAPAVANGMVYALSADQVLYAIGASTGKIRYNVRVPGTVSRMTPVAAGDYVFVGGGQNLLCFMGRNLMQRWMQPLPNEIVTSPTVDKQNIYVVTSDNAVYSFDARTGRPRWKTIPKLEYDVLAAPAVAGNILLIGTTQGELYALDTETGKINWSYSIQPTTRDVSGGTSGRAGFAPGNITGPPGLGGPGAPRGGANNSVSTGSLPTYTNVAASPVVSDGTVYVLSDDGSLSAFRSDATDTQPPTISDIEPDMGLLINGAPPIRFEAKIMDEGSGVNPDSVRLSLDGEGVGRRPEGRENENKPGYKFDMVESRLRYDTPEPTSAGTVKPLSDGLHTITVTATDWMGNTATKTWSFTVDNSIARTSRRVQQQKQQGDNTMRGPGTGGPGGMGPGGPGGSGGPGGYPGGRGGRGGRGGGRGGRY